MTNFSQKTIWITGASSGIGEALAIKCAGLGAKLILSARNQAELERVRKQCQNPDAHKVVPMDLEDYAHAEAIATATCEALGPIDVLINNAGVSQRYSALDGSSAIDAKIMNTNYVGTVAITRPVLKAMTDHKKGHIVVVSSVLGLYGIQSRSAYAASKHALRGYFESLRNELSESPIGITMVYPGYVKTNVSKNAITATGKSYGKMDKSHQAAMSAEDCATQIVRAIAKRRDVLVLGGFKEILGVYMSTYTPALFRRLAPRLKV